MNNRASNKGRSDALLPADDDSTEDGRLEVAEEVSLDQQSDAARRVGQAPAADVRTPTGTAADAIAESLAPAGPEKSNAAEGAPGRKPS